MSEMPGGGVAKRPLHFFILADCSGSMTEGGKIQALNAAVEELLPQLGQASEENFHATILVRALVFSHGATWHVSTPSDPASLHWPPLRAGGVTDLGAALRELATVLTSPPMDARAFPPAVVLISDGQPTDDFAGGLAAFESSQWGMKAQKFAVAIGADADRAVLERFMNNPEIPVLEARNAEHLKDLLQFVSTAAVGASIVPGGGPIGEPPKPIADNLLDTWV